MHDGAAGFLAQAAGVAEAEAKRKAGRSATRGSRADEGVRPTLITRLHRAVPIRFHHVHRQHTQAVQLRVFDQHGG